MASIRLDQPTFTQGQLDPRVQSRTDWENYYKAAKAITNGLVIPQGGVQRRWGTEYVDTCTVVGTNFNFAEISTLVYNDNATYLFLWEALSLKIYFENKLVATVATQYNGEDIPLLRFSQIQTRAIVNSGNFQNQQVVRSNDAPVAITAFTGAPTNTLTAALPYAAGLVLPAQFTTTGALPTTNPQIYANRDYFIRMITATTFSIYSTSSDAANNVNAYVITALGVNSNVVVQNTWAISNIPFKFIPAYDFNGGYFAAAFTFTPSAVSGAITLTSSGNIFTAAMVGGLYEGNGGIVRLTGYTNPTTMTGYTIVAFPNVNPIRGDLSFLGEPAWSNTRGWPKTSSFLQNRFVLANSASLPNGVWQSVINDVYNFDDSQTLADDCIAYYPESGTMTVVQSLTAARSLIAHTATGNYSSPVQSELALTPTNFVLIEQNKFGVGPLQPVFIDNQIFFVDRSGNNIINMIWEFTQSSYVTNNISVKASSLINQPIDMTAFAEPNSVDGFYVLFVNTDGSLCVLQTLHEENILAFSLSNTNTYATNGDGTNYVTIPDKYVKVTAVQNRCWFLVDRLVPVIPSVAIVGFSAVNNTLQANAHGMAVGTPTVVTFATTGTLPTSVPTLSITEYYWAVATDANNFKVYANEADATAGLNFFVISSAGVTSTVTRYTHTLMIEEADFDFFTDSSVLVKSAAAITVITGLGHLNGQVVQVVGDGFVLDDQIVVGGQITIERASYNIRVGLRFRTSLVPLPPAIPQQQGTLYQQRHIRDLYISYYKTIGSTIQSYGVPVITMQQVIIGALPVPQTGVFEYTLMEGWDGATPPDIEIVQEAPLPMTILALSYILEI